MNLRNFTVILLLWASTCLYAEVEVLARFEPSRVAVGSTAKYIVEVTDSDSDAFYSAGQIDSLPIPPVGGMVFRNGQTSTSQTASVVNGRAEYKVTHQIVADAIPPKVGSYTVPDYAVEYKGKRLQVPAATLTVVERSDDAASMTNELIFLTLEAPEKLYVGQIESATLRLYVASDVRLGDYIIEPDTDGFITSGGPPEEPAASVEVVNGRRYRVYAWPLTITPISSGKQDLNFQSTLIAQFPTQRNVRGSPFGNSIFDDFFNRGERVNVYTKPTQVDVLPLPKEGQPQSFSGAIGQFNISVNTDAKSTRVNEPIMLSLKISGQGNFDRIQGPEIPKVKGWRSYSPESVFEADTANRIKGTKRFDYVCIPEKAGTLELPEVSFSFFDPDVEKYVELSSPATTIEVAPAKVSLSPPPPNLSNTASGSESAVSPEDKLARSLTSEELLRTLDYRPERGRQLPTGSIFTPSFYWINDSFFVVIVIVVLFNYRRKCLLQSPYYSLIQDAREELKATVNKTKSDEADTFFSNAQKAIRLAATIRVKSNLRTADFTALEAHLRQTGLNETVIDQTRKLFQSAETYQFSGHQQNVDLPELHRQLKSILKAL
jgi:hypothetical protein